jgi:hypothetical protein
LTSPQKQASLTATQHGPRDSGEVGENKSPGLFLLPGRRQVRPSCLSRAGERGNIETPEQFSDPDERFFSVSLLEEANEAYQGLALLFPTKPTEKRTTSFAILITWGKCFF